MIHAARLLATTALAFGLAAPAIAADTPDPAPTPTARASADKLAAARGLIAESKWVAAISELQRVNDRNNADWNNLMGYSHRKAKTPDLVAAEKYYNEALRIDPKHQGALEYSGELALIKGDLAAAEAKLATLAGLCKSPCEALDDLKQSIDRYKANGNRYAP